jgi:hypothetical protein
MLRRLAVASRLFARGRDEWHWHRACATEGGSEKQTEELHAALAPHCPSLTRVAVKELIALEPCLATQPGLKAAAERCSELASVLPDFARLYGREEVAMLLAGDLGHSGPRLFERLVARGRPAGTDAPSPATLLRLTRQFRANSFIGEQYSDKDIEEEAALSVEEPANREELEERHQEAMSMTDTERVL